MTLAPLFFDLDHTLWDFETNSRLALGQGFKDLELASLGVADLPMWIRHYEAANDHCWAEFRAGRMDKATLRDRRFELALEACGVACPEDFPSRLGSITWLTARTKRPSFQEPWTCLRPCVRAATGCGC